MDKEMKARIDAMTHEEMAFHWRFDPATTDSMFVGETFEYFKDRFAELGGMTPGVSKKIGWER